jgi:homoserine O-succinyltransferase/O-acetyltransferase
MSWARAGRLAPLRIGLVNNSGDRGLHTTERRFMALLLAAMPHTPIAFTFFTCPEIARDTPPMSREGQPYAGLDALRDADLDALIVTGMEPCSDALEDEPVWRSLAGLVDWTGSHNLPVIWSCLAAHAAVLRLDGIRRRRAPAKLSGLYAIDTFAPANPLMRDCPGTRTVPHSRQYGLDAASLSRCGYTILTGSDDIGVDTFMHQDQHPFLFLQGHPEYEPATLAQEYVRDVRRYLCGRSDQYPELPHDYFEPGIERALRELREWMIMEGGNSSLLTELGALTAAAGAGRSWREPAAQLCRNWIRTVVNIDLDSTLPALRAAPDAPLAEHRP